MVQIKAFIINNEEHSILMEIKIYNSYISLLDLLELIPQRTASVETTNKIKAKLKLFITDFQKRIQPEDVNKELLNLAGLAQENKHLSELQHFYEKLINIQQINAQLIQKLIICTKQAYSSLNLQEPDLIFLLTAPFDEAAKTGDGQYAQSLVQGFQSQEKKTSCVWLKEADGHYNLRLRSGLNSIPPQTIPTIYVLQPVANGQTVVSGYQCPSDELLSVAELKIRSEITLRTPKIVLDKNNRLKYIGYQSEQGLKILTEHDVLTQKELWTSQLNQKVQELLGLTTQQSELTAKYTQIDIHFSAVLKAMEAVKKLPEEEIHTINKIITGIKQDFPRFKIEPLKLSDSHEVIVETSTGIKTSLKRILAEIKANIKNKEQETAALEKKILLFEELKKQFASNNLNQAELFVYVKQLAKIESSNSRQLNTPQEFNKALQIAIDDNDRKAAVSTLLSTIQHMSKNKKCGIDIHIRPPDTGILIMPEEILEFKRLGLSVNITVHEYKQNYTRRFLQQMTHELLRHADSVLFFNQKDQHNAIKAAHSGQVDGKHPGDWPITPYELRAKTELTVAAQILSGTPPHPLQVLKKAPNILSFGTIRPGKGFEETLEIAQLLNIKPSPLNLQPAEQTIADKITVVVAGDPQNGELMEQLFAERYGAENLKKFQTHHPYISQGLSNGAKRIYWKKAKLYLEIMSKPLNNPHLELYPWCPAEELTALKARCKYVCRMDDMGMRNNGSAIISVLDVGIVYTKWGCVTDKYYTDTATTDVEGESYTAAVDLGETKYGLHNPGERNTWDKKLKIESDFKRRTHARSPKEILHSIIKREIDQVDKNEVQQLDTPRSLNHYTVFTAQRLLLTKFALKKSIHALKSIFVKEYPGQPNNLTEEAKTPEPVQTKTTRYARIRASGNKVKKAFFWAQEHQDDLSLTTSMETESRSEMETQLETGLLIPLRVSC